MGTIYTPNTRKHWFTDSLYDTPTFRKLWHGIDFIYFRHFYTSMAKQTPAMIQWWERRLLSPSLPFAYELCHKLYCPKMQLSVCKLLALLKCQLHFNQYIKTKRVCLEIKLYKLTSSNGTTLTFQLTARKVCFIIGMRIVMCHHQKETLFTNYFFSITDNTWYSTSFR